VQQNSPRKVVRGRDASYLAPAQIRTCGFPAYGSHLGHRRQVGAVDASQPLSPAATQHSLFCRPMFGCNEMIITTFGW